MNNKKGNFNIMDIEILSCPSCPSCDVYNGCYCNFLNVQIVPYAIADWGKSGYKVSYIIDNSSDNSGLVTPYRR